MDEDGVYQTLSSRERPSRPLSSQWAVVALALNKLRAPCSEWAVCDSVLEYLLPCRRWWDAHHWRLQRFFRFLRY